MSRATVRLILKVQTFASQTSGVAKQSGVAAGAGGLQQSAIVAALPHGVATSWFGGIIHAWASKV